MLKYFSTLILLFLFPSSSVAQSQVIIKQHGFGDQHKLKVILNGQTLKSSANGETLIDTLLLIEQPMMGMILKEDGRYAGFYIEPLATEVSIFSEGFPNSIEVKGSTSHQVYQAVNYTSSKKEFIDNFLKYKDSPVALDVMNSKFIFEDMTKEDLLKVYDATAPKNQNLLADLKARIDTYDIPKVVKGSAIYDFTAEDAEQNSFSTKDYRGKYLLLDFAATNCGPCWSGYPDMVEEAQKYNNLQILTYNEDSAIDTWNKIAKARDIKLEWPVLWAGMNKKEIFELYNVEGWPLHFLISPEGKVLETWFGSGGNTLSKKLKKHLK